MAKQPEQSAASQAASALVRKRWSKATKKQRLEVGKQLAEARAAAKRKKAKK